jgi:hypothetical protein
MARALMALTAFAYLAAADASAATLVIQVQGVQSGQGVIYAAVCATGFAEGDCPYKGRQAAAVGTVELRIQDVRPGAYALAVCGAGPTGGPMTIPALAERIVALRGLDAQSGAVRAAVEGTAGRALRHQRSLGTVCNPPRTGRLMLWELAE